MRRAARIDDNQKQLVKDLRAVGCTVRSLAPMGNGCPDLLVGVHIAGKRENYLLEVKNPSRPKNKRKLLPGQKHFAEEWQGQVDTVETLDDALRVIGLLAKGQER